MAQPTNNLTLRPNSGWNFPGSRTISWLRVVSRGAPKFSLFYIVIAILFAICAPLYPLSPVEGDLGNMLAKPSWSANILGTDHLGRDEMARLIHGARISVSVALLTVLFSGAVGTLIALLAGVMKGWVDSVLMNITDAFLALPFLMVAVTIVSLLGQSMINVILVLGLLRWMSYARILRSEVLTLTETDYVKLAQVAGASRVRIISRHIFPNLVNTLLVVSTLEVGTVVIFESALSFLGLGVPRPMPSWGTMLADSQSYLYTNWWLPFFPGLAISLLVMSGNLTGDWLRDRTDPIRRQL